MDQSQIRNIAIDIHSILCEYDGTMDKRVLDTKHMAQLESVVAKIIKAAADEVARRQGILWPGSNLADKAKPD